MQDFRIIQAQTILPTTSVTPIRGFVPPSIIVTGRNLDQTQEVLYNGIEADEFVVSSPSRLIVKIPSSQLGKDLTSITVLASASVTKQSAMISMRFSNPPKKLSGIDRLVQAWMMIFFTTPGSDVFSPSSGGGVKSLIGKNTTKNSNGNSITSDLVLCVERTKNELLRLQSQDSRIPPSERLLSASLSDVKFNPNTTTLSAVVTLQNMLGQSADLTVR